MTNPRITDASGVLVALPAGGARWKRRAVVFGVPLLGALLLLLLLWNVFFRYVPPGHMLVITSKNGRPLEEGQVLAEEGQKGILREVRGEGYHFVWPIIYTTKLEKNVVVESGKVGVVTALGGVPPRSGGVMAERPDEKGILREVLLPGAYRLNPYGYTVDQAEMSLIKPGYVGIKRRLLGKDGPTEFATDPTMKGIIRDEILQPGLYPINTKEYEIIPCEVGIYQTSYHYAENAQEKNTALTFQARDGYPISLDCTIEWEIKPEFWPVWLTKFRSRERIEKNVIDLHVNQICQIRGSKYEAEDFLKGAEREKFQADFRTELGKASRADNVIVRSAFIRNIIIPDRFLAVKRKEAIAVEQKVTSEALTMTAKSAAEVAEAKQMIAQREAEVQAETERMVAVVKRETQNVKDLVEADLEKMKAGYGAKIGELDTQRKLVLRQAEAEATKLKETAKGSLYKMKMEVFGREGDAFLRYTMAQQLNPKMQLRLFQSGPGTLWTNMGNKDVRFMLPLPAGGEKASGRKAEEKADKER
jgi:hypothetical protein